MKADEAPSPAPSRSRAMNRSGQGYTVQPQVVSVLPKNAAERVVISLAEVDECPVVDVRVFEKLEHDSDFERTKRGITLRLAQLPDLIRALEKVQEQVRRQSRAGGLP